MWKKKNSLFNRTVSGAMGIIMTAISAFSPLTTLPVYAGESLIDMDYRQVKSDKVEIHVQSEGMSFEPGSEVQMKVFVQNNTEKTLVKGGLSWRNGNDVLEDKQFILLDEEEQDETELAEDETVGVAINENGTVTNITLEPGEVYEVGFRATVDDSLELFSRKEIGFFFGAYDAEYPDDVDKVETRTVDFAFTAGLVSLHPVEHGDENHEIEAGSTGSMALELVLDTSEYSYEMTKEELTTETATDSNSEEEPETATDSNSEEEPETATDSNSEEEPETATDSNGEEEPETATDSNGEEEAETATDSNSEEDEDEDEYLLELNKIAYDISTYNVKFDNFEIVDAELNEGGNSVTAYIEYEVDENTTLGTYFGRIDAVVELDGKNFYATQGFDVTVVEAEPALTAEQLAEVQSVIDMIAKLPTMEEYWAATDRFFLDENGNELAEEDIDLDGLDAYQRELAAIAIPAWEAYQALSEEQKTLIPAEAFAKLEFIYGMCEGVTFDTYHPIDSTVEENIQMYLFDYGFYIDTVDKRDSTSANIVVDNGNVLNFYNNIGQALDQYDKQQDNQNRPIFEKTLVNGYPQVNGYLSNGAGNTGSLKYLFDKERDNDFEKGNGSLFSYDLTANSNYESMRFKINNDDGSGTGLFKKDGSYYYYSSSENAAYFNQKEKKFELYDYIERPNYVEATVGNGSEQKGGLVDIADLNVGTESERTAKLLAMQQKVRFENFLPFNLGHEDGTVYAGTGSREGQQLIQFAGTTRDNTANMWFGMTMEFEFLMPKNGQVYNPENGSYENMVFEFFGDDDVLVYIDDVLVLDMGDDHYAEYGTIDFATGKVVHPKPDHDSHADEAADYGEYSLYQKYVDAGREQTTDFKNVTGDSSPDTFEDYSKHTLKFFYLERGGYYSYCALRFNIQSLPANSLTVTKTVTADDSVNMIEDTVFFPYRVLRADSSGNKTEELFIAEGTSYDIYENGVDTGKNGVVDENGYFYLRHNQSAVFENMMGMFDGAETTDYFVEEVLSPGEEEQYESVQYSVNGSANTEASKSKDGELFIHSSSGIEPDATQQVAFTNKAKEKLGSLSISKEITAGTVYPENQTFKLQVKLGDTENKQQIADYNNGDNMKLLPVGTVYLVDGVEKTVEEPGIIEIKVGETATFEDGILHGTNYEVKEVVPNGSDYHEVYSVITNGSESGYFGKEGASGTYEMDDDVHITVTNSEYDFAVQLPINKKYTGNTEPEEIQFTIIEVVNENNQWVEKTGEIQNANRLPNAMIEITEASLTEGNTVAIIGYENSVDVGDHFYKISETIGSRDDAVYDSTWYLVKVTVSETNGNKSAVISEVLKNGIDNMAANSGLTFVNRAVTGITISKVVTGNLGDRSKIFDFIISVFVDGNNYTSYTISSGGVINKETGEFALSHGQSITLENIPIGSKVTVTETSGDGYEASYEIGSAQSVEGSQAVVNELPKDGVIITFTNHKEATIDTGILLDSAPYIATLAIALGGMAIYVISKRKKEEDDME